MEGYKNYYSKFSAADIYFQKKLFLLTLHHSNLQCFYIASSMIVTDCSNYGVETL